MFTFIMISILALLVGVGIYFVFFIKRFFSVFIKSKAVCYIVSVLMVASVGAGSFYLLRFGAVIILLHLFFVALLTQLIFFVLRKTLLKRRYIAENQKKNYFEVIYKLGVVPVAVTLAVAIIGHIIMVSVSQTHYTYETNKLAGGESIRVAMISDLHMGTTMNCNDLQKYMKEIEKTKPDAFFLVGDIVDESTTKEEMTEAFKIMGNVKTKDGVYYVYGNHDRNIYKNHTMFTDKELESAITDSGIKILTDDVVEFDDYIVVGRDDYSSTTEEYSRKPIYQLTEGVDKSKYIISLDHQPRDLPDVADADVDLHFSGHTHGGQVWPVGWISNILGVFEMTYGEKQIDNTHIVVSSGIASWGYSLRTQGKSEYVVVDIVGTK
ncbi:MAG: metallophosphoesterase [Oscillospiraceae bacterium]|nr:metallophosphoesterase [Oscillospiraceae bacterium]